MLKGHFVLNRVRHARLPNAPDELSRMHLYIHVALELADKELGLTAYAIEYALRDNSSPWQQLPGTLSQVQGQGADPIKIVFSGRGSTGREFKSGQEEVRKLRG